MVRVPVPQLPPLKEPQPPPGPAPLDDVLERFARLEALLLAMGSGSPSAAPAPPSPPPPPPEPTNWPGMELSDPQ